MAGADKPSMESGTYVSVARSDIEKIRDVVYAAVKHHHARDASNAALHLGQVRYSPLTSELIAALERLWGILGIGVAERDWIAGEFDSYQWRPR